MSVDPLGGRAPEGCYLTSLCFDSLVYETGILTALSEHTGGVDPMRTATGLGTHPAWAQQILALISYDSIG